MTVTTKQSIKQIFHPYWLWEEVDSNMWGSVSNRKISLNKAIKFTGDHKLYGRWMICVIEKWKYSCEHNLSNITQNRRAWIGQAAVALALGIPEDIVREAWGHLTEEQQTLANKKADEAIAQWEFKHLEESGDICQNVDWVEMYMTNQ
jgi:hypothetical protein